MQTIKKNPPKMGGLLKGESGKNADSGRKLDATTQLAGEPKGSANAK
jgi:hypothetical protein